MAYKDKEKERQYQRNYYQANKDRMKKTTSTEAKARYNKKTYSQLVLNVRKEKLEAYRAKCNALGITYSKPLHDAIDAFLNEGGKTE